MATNSRAETVAFLMTTRTQGWPVVMKVIQQLAQNQMEKACDAVDNNGALAQRAGGARELVAEFTKIVAGLEAAIQSETAPDWR